MEVVMSMHDLHVPYHDIRAIKCALKLAVHVQPKILILHEVNDFYALSKFNKDPIRKLQLQEELDEAFKIRQMIRKALPKTRIIELNSNHNKRLKKFLDSKAEELSYLRCLRIESLLGLDELNIEFLEDFVFRGVLFKHGDLVRKDSSYTAKAEFDKEGMSGASGHTHRLGQYYKTLRGGSYVWIEGGCLCDLNPDYIEGCANWQHGVSMYMFKDKSNCFQAKVVPIISYEVLWGKHIFKG